MAQRRAPRPKPTPTQRKRDSTLALNLARKADIAELRQRLSELDQRVSWLERSRRITETQAIRNATALHRGGASRT